MLRTEGETLGLADVYAVITYYLRHRSDVDAYLQERRARGQAIRREIEAHSPQTGLRERLLARRGQLVRAQSLN